MPTKAELEAQAAADARMEKQAGQLRKLHSETRVPDPKKVARREGSGGKMLDYLGHADATDLLLIHDPHWNWEPVAWTEKGMPAIVLNAQNQPVGLWIRLTVHGVTRLGYGSCAPGKADAVKELIGDAIRNAAMRFGVALELWSKAGDEGWADLPEPSTPGEATQDPTPPANGNAPDAVKAPLTPEAPPEPTPPAAPLDPLDDPYSELNGEALRVEVGRRMGAMRGHQAIAFAAEKRAQGWPGDLTQLEDEGLRAVLAWLQAQPVERVVG